MDHQDALNGRGDATPSSLSVLQEPAASRNGCAVLHYVSAVPVQLTA
ncbi:hypothetical protein [Agrobacterium sp. LAD9]|nr:hypothetical protein [Agrobacterium sp. LAD9]